MPSKSTGAERQRRYRERMRQAGLRQVLVYWPSDQVDELRRLSAVECEKAAGAAWREWVRASRQRSLPLDDQGAGDD